MIRPTTRRISGGKRGATALLIASWLLCAPLRAQTSKTEGEARITSAGPIGVEASQKFVIRGMHFGTYKPYNGCEPFLRITNLRNNQTFGLSDPGLCAPVLVTSWTDTEIVVEGFPPFEPGRNVFDIGDVIKIEVANPEQRGWVTSGDNFNGAPVAWFSVRVGEATPPPIAPQAQIAPDTTVPTTRSDVTIPAGQSLLIRMIDGVESSKNHVGDIFHVRLETD